jgi:L-threonylcarbamoyladenylate synthase
MSDRLSDDPRIIRVPKDEEQWDGLVQVAAEIIARGGLIVVPTDTVYGVACDPFNPSAVGALFNAKARGRDLPLPILVHTWRQTVGLVEEVTGQAETLFEHYWPGPLTVVLKQSPGLGWDLGESRGTVALRMPKQDFLLKVIERTGPLAVTSANRSGEPTPGKVPEVVEQLGDSVDAYFDDGWRMGHSPSTIVDLTGPKPVVLREGAIATADLETVLEVPLLDYTEEADEDDELADPNPDEHADPEPFYPEGAVPSTELAAEYAARTARDNPSTPDNDHGNRNGQAPDPDGPGGEAEQDPDDR